MFTSKVVFFVKCGKNFLFYLSLMECPFNSDKSLAGLEKLLYLYDILLNILPNLLNTQQFYIQFILNYIYDVLHLKYRLIVILLLYK